MKYVCQINDGNMKAKRWSYHLWIKSMFANSTV